jgi:hypothetical protein
MAYDRRDLIGHWIRKSQRTEQMCTHACCRGYRIHPRNMPVILPNRLLRRASDRDLAEHFNEVSGQRTAEETASWYQVLAEMERRDKQTARRAAARERHEATVLGRRFERAEAVEHAYVQAENATRGHMVNKAGRANGIDPRSLLTGPESRARRYASEELLAHWETHPRPTARFFAGGDTPVHEQYTAPRRRLSRVVERRTVVTGRGRGKRPVSVAVIRREGPPKECVGMGCRKRRVGPGSPLIRGSQPPDIRPAGLIRPAGPDVLSLPPGLAVRRCRRWWPSRSRRWSLGCCR